MKTQNDLLSAELKVPLLEGEQRVKFKLWRSGARDPKTVDLASGHRRIVSPSGHYLPKSITITDPKNGNVILQSIESYMPVAAKPGETQKFVPQLVAQYFDEKGEIEMTANDNPDLYIFLKRYPGNSDNPFRDKNKKIVFYEINEEKILNEEISKAEIISHLMSSITSYSDTEIEELSFTLKETGAKEFASLTPNVGKPKSERNKLYNLTMQYPHLIANHNPDQKFRMLKKILDLEKVQKVYFDKRADMWKVRRDVGEEGIKNLFNVNPGEDRYWSFVEYLLSTGTEGESSKEKEVIVKLYELYYSLTA